MGEDDTLFTKALAGKGLNSFLVKLWDEWWTKEKPTSKLMILQSFVVFVQGRLFKNFSTIPKDGLICTDFPTGSATIQVFHKHTKFAIMPILPTLYSHIGNCLLYVNQLMSENVKLEIKVYLRISWIQIILYELILNSQKLGMLVSFILWRECENPCCKSVNIRDIRKSTRKVPT